MKAIEDVLVARKDDAFPLSRRAAWRCVGGLASLFVSSVAMGEPARIISHSVPRNLPELTFRDEAGEERKFSSFLGKTVVLNIWATWCVPCRTEMPSLSRLRTMLLDEPIEVVALSVDRNGGTAVRRFYNDIGISNLPIYFDQSGKTLRDLGGYGLPMTIIVNAEGHEVARLIGPAEWDDQGTLDFLSGLARHATEKSITE